MIEIREQSKYEKLMNERSDLIVIIIDKVQHSLTKEAFKELQSKLNTFAIHGDKETKAFNECMKDNNIVILRSYFDTYINSAISKEYVDEQYSKHKSL
jgi:hypothetical protein